MDDAPDPPLTTARAAQAAGTSVHTLRYYERARLLDHVERGPSGRRRYRIRDLRSVEFIVRLRGTGMPIARIREYADLVRSGGDERVRLALLEEHRDAVLDALAEQGRHLAAIEKKIALYREHLALPPQENP